MPMTLPVLYQDEWFVAVNKPSGLLVHRSRIDRAARVFALQVVRDQVGRHVYPVHRLDKPTSGVLVFGLSPEAARGLAEAFAERRIEKTYLAIVRGHPPASGTIDRPLVEVRDKTTDALAQPDKPAQPAVTEFERLATCTLPMPVDHYPTRRYALVRLRPRTGRRHQLRRHLNAIAHPIIGDGKHGDYRHNRFFREQYGCDRLLLAATALAFTHPFTEEPVQITAPLDPVFLALLDRFSWRGAVGPELISEAPPGPA